MVVIHDGQSLINVPGALSVKCVGKLPDPLVGHPLASKEDWTSGVKHVHVRPTTPLDVVPEDGGSLGGGHGHAKSGESCVTSPGGAKHIILLGSLFRH